MLLGSNVDLDRAISYLRTGSLNAGWTRQTEAYVHHLAAPPRRILPEDDSRVRDFRLAIPSNVTSESALLNIAASDVLAPLLKPGDAQSGALVKAPSLKTDAAIEPSDAIKQQSGDHADALRDAQQSTEREGHARRAVPLVQLSRVPSTEVALAAALPASPRGATGTTGRDSASIRVLLPSGDWLRLRLSRSAAVVELLVELLRAIRSRAQPVAGPLRTSSETSDSAAPLATLGAVAALAVPGTPIAQEALAILELRLIANSKQPDMENPPVDTSRPISNFEDPASDAQGGTEHGPYGSDDDDDASTLNSMGDTQEDGRGSRLMTERRSRSSLATRQRSLTEVDKEDNDSDDAGGGRHGGVRRARVAFALLLRETAEEWVRSKLAVVHDKNDQQRTGDAVGAGSALAAAPGAAPGEGPAAAPVLRKDSAGDSTARTQGAGDVTSRTQGGTAPESSAAPPPVTPRAAASRSARPSAAGVTMTPPYTPGRPGNGAKGSDGTAAPPPGAGVPLDEAQGLGPRITKTAAAPLPVAGQGGVSGLSALLSGGAATAAGPSSRHGAQQAGGKPAASSAGGGDSAGDAGRQPLGSSSSSSSQSASSRDLLGGGGQLPVSLRVLVQVPAPGSSGGGGSGGGGGGAYVVTVPYKDDLRAADVIEFVARRNRLPLFRDKLLLRVTHSEAGRLGLPSRELHPMTRLAPLGLDSIELIRKVYADAPPDPRKTGGGASVGGGRGGGGYHHNWALQEAIDNLNVGRPPLPAHGGPGGAGDRGAGGYYLTSARGGGDTTRGPGGTGNAYRHQQQQQGGRGAEDDDVGSLYEGDVGGGRDYRGGSTGGGPSGSGSGSGNNNLRPFGGGGGAPPAFLHNVLSAAQFQEWKVVKTNRRGRRQERLLGIDLHRLTNRKVEKARLFFSDATVHAERMVSDVRRVEIPETHRTAFTVTVADRGQEGGGGGGGRDSEVTLQYEAQSAAERDEIVAKLAWILRQTGAAHKIVRTV